MFRVKKREYRDVKVDYPVRKGEYRVKKGEYRVAKVEYRVRKGEFRVKKSEYRVVNGEYRVRKGEYRVKKGEKKLFKNLSNPPDVEFYPSRSTNKFFPKWSNVKFSLLSAFLSNTHSEKKQQQTYKQKIHPPESNRVPLDHQSCVMHKLRNYYRN